MKEAIKKQIDRNTTLIAMNEQALIKKFESLQVRIENAQENIKKGFRAEYEAIGIECEAKELRDLARNIQSKYDENTMLKYFLEEAKE